MRLHIGSIQRKGRVWHLVTRVGSMSKWISLKTEDAKTARIRARRLLPPDDGEGAWLAHLARIGAKAERELARRRAAATLSWGNLWDVFSARVSGRLSPSCESSGERWCRILSEVAASLGLPPQSMSSKEACADVVARLSAAYVSSRRMVGFFRRVWRTLGLDEDVWPRMTDKRDANRPQSEFYRRLSLDETRNVYRQLASEDRDLADMVVIGYSTGLRLSDVAELEMSEIDRDCRFLRIVPNKTRWRKPYPLTVPCTEQIGGVLARRIAEDVDADGFLFAKSAQRRPSRRISAAFRLCGVNAHGNGRASFHSLRATFISMMDEAGVPPHMTDAITGHSGGDMHSRYSQPSAAALLAAVKRAIPPL